MAGPPPPLTLWVSEQQDLLPVLSVHVSSGCRLCGGVWPLLLRPLCFSSSLGRSCMLDPCRRGGGPTEGPCWVRAWVLVSSLSCCHGNRNAVSNSQIKTRHTCRHQQLEQVQASWFQPIIAHGLHRRCQLQLLPGSCGRHGNRVGDRTLEALLVLEQLPWLLKFRASGPERRPRGSRTSDVGPLKVVGILEASPTFRWSESCRSERESRICGPVL